MAEWAAKRFWKTVSCVPESDGFAIHLDSRPVRTPAKTPIILPTQALAQAVAAEWEAQDDKIRPETMPFTRSANAALDKVAPQREAVENMIADYAGTDLLCYRANGPETLVARQAESWDPVLRWADDVFDAKLTITTGVMPVAQPDASVRALTRTMAEMSAFDIVGFHDLVSLSGSFILGLAVAKDHLKPDVAWALSRVDETWQAEQWGQDEEAEEKVAIKYAAFLHAHQFIAMANR